MCRGQSEKPTDEFDTFLNAVFMYLNEAKSEQEKNDLAIIIEEMLSQRYEGVKNELGIYITPAFPKLIYVLEPDNIDENGKFWYFDPSGGQMYCQTSGARLYFGKKDEGAERG